MSSKPSKILTKAINEYKSCFGCTFFKLKPFKINKETNQVSIDFKITSEKVRCIKNQFSLLALGNITGIKSSTNTRTDKPVILRDSIKCIDRYKRIAEICKEYEGEN